MQPDLSSQIANNKSVFLYLLIFRWLSLAYLFILLLGQKSSLEPIIYGVLSVAVLYVLLLTLFQRIVYDRVSQKPILLSVDLLLSVIFLVLGGWPRAWFFYNITTVACAALLGGYIEIFTFAAVNCASYVLSLNLNFAGFSGSPEFLRLESVLFPIAGFGLAGLVAALLRYQRRKDQNAIGDLQVNLSRVSDQLQKAEMVWANKMVEAVQGAASMSTLKEPYEILTLLVENSRKMMQAEKVAAVLLDRERGKAKLDLDTLVVRGRKDQHLESWWKAELDEMAMAVVAGEGVHESRKGQEQNGILPYHVSRKSNESTSMICVPLKARNKNIGILSAFNAYPYYFAEEEISLLSVLAEQAAVLISESKRLQGGLGVSSLEFEQELERITTQCLQSQEAERKRISRELHDNTAQSLTHLIIRLQKVDGQIPPELDELKKSMSKLIDIAERTLEDVHEMAFQMRPAILEDLGLVETIRWYISHYLGTATLSVNFATLERNVQFPPHVEIAVLRIIQEGLTNVRKYAKASEAYVNLELVGEELVVTIEDNGEGFDVEKILATSAEKKSLGLKGMKERAELIGGSLEILSEPGKGTKITAAVPLRIKK